MQRASIISERTTCRLAWGTMPSDSFLQDDLLIYHVHAHCSSWKDADAVLFLRPFHCAVVWTSVQSGVE
jgi:hypothetical protein